MKVNIDKLDEFTNGWFIGNFSPALLIFSEIEIAVKYFKAGQKEPLHKQIVATEITVVIEGIVNFGGKILNKGDIATVLPGEALAFESITDSAIVCIKTPSIPMDKVLVQS
jgi:quercetin dioxygenase-like cupin family protein